MITYSIRKRNETNEHHIFEGTLTSTDPRECSTRKSSICNKAKFDETSTINLSCLAEETARAKAAVLGRSVCGTCVSHLYATPE